MRNRLAVTLALTAFLSLGGMTFGKTSKPQNTNTSGTMSGSAKSGHKSRHRRHHKHRHHRKAAAATNANTHR